MTLALTGSTMLSGLSFSQTQAVPYGGKGSQAIPEWYSQAQATTGVHWSLLAGLDVYGASTKPPVGVSRPKRQPHPVVGYRFTQAEWQGLFNPVQDDINPMRIGLFGGRGADGDKDGKADQNDPYDRVRAVAAWLRHGGASEDEQVNVLWNHFENEVAVQRVTALAHVFRHFGTIQLSERAFPIHKRYSYSYRDTWGEGRSFGGRRIHEGTDIFAGYGAPVLSTCFGYVELIGWNRLGGWRIGLRSADNTYFYYAHLSSYARSVRQGIIVRPGQVLGYVGSSGYGKPGTSGKFPPHLHFGIYRDTGTREWAFDPYPLLRQWERKPQVIISPPKKGEEKERPSI